MSCSLWGRQRPRDGPRGQPALPTCRRGGGKGGAAPIPARLGYLGVGSEVSGCFEREHNLGWPLSAGCFSSWGSRDKASMPSVMVNGSVCSLLCCVKGSGAERNPGLRVGRDFKKAAMGCVSELTLSAFSVISSLIQKPPFFFSFPQVWIVTQTLGYEMFQHN